MYTFVTFITDTQVAAEKSLLYVQKGANTFAYAGGDGGGQVEESGEEPYGGWYSDGRHSWYGWHCWLGGARCHTAVHHSPARLQASVVVDAADINFTDCFIL